MDQAKMEVKTWDFPSNVGHHMLPLLFTTMEGLVTSETHWPLRLPKFMVDPSALENMLLQIHLFHRTCCPWMTIWLSTRISLCRCAVFSAGWKILSNLVLGNNYYQAPASVWDLCEAWHLLFTSECWSTGSQQPPIPWQCKNGWVPGQGCLCLAHHFSKHLDGIYHTTGCWPRI